LTSPTSPEKQSGGREEGRERERERERKIKERNTEAKGRDRPTWGYARSNAKPALRSGGGVSQVGRAHFGAAAHRAQTLNHFQLHPSSVGMRGLFPLTHPVLEGGLGDLEVRVFRDEGADLRPKRRSAHAADAVRH